MSILLRGIAWFTLYLLMAGMPLAVAALADPIVGTRPFLLELGVAAGFVAFALSTVEFALVARLRSASEPFGTDALMLLHRGMGIVALAFVVGHVVFVTAPLGLGVLDPLGGGLVTQSGLLALAATLVLVVASVYRRRLRLAYELWLGTHRLAALVLMGAMLAHALAVDAYTSARSVRLVLLGYTAAFLALLLRYRVLRPLALRRRPWEVVENREEGADTRTLVVRPVGHAGISCAPGQFAWLVTGRSPFSREQHPISISSSTEPRPAANAPGTLEFTIKALGDWSRTVVPTLAPGTRLWIDGPFGAFSPDRLPAQGVVLIAGGIGIAPMRSILATWRDRGDPRRALLFYAAHDPGRAIWADELERLERELDLEIVRVYEDPPADWSGERGFVTRATLERHLPRAARHHQFFVCGPSAMMDAVEASLLELGVPPARIQTERFDMV